MTRSSRRSRALPGRGAGSRPAVVLFLVVVVVAIAALVGGAAMTSAATERGAASAAREMAQSRALAWSGVQAVMAELAEQREDMLAGGAPTVTESWELYADAGGRGVVRLVDQARAGEEPRFVTPESGKLCVNTATASMLVDLGIDQAMADRIIATRSQRAFGSVEELLRVPGMTASRLGPGWEEPESTTGAESAVEGAPPGTDLVSLLTVFSFDPNIQGGLAEDGERFRGLRRVNLDQPWSSRLERALIERFNEDAATGVRNIMEQGTTFARDKDIVATLRRLGLPPETWGDVLDVFTASDDEYQIGRVDLRTAPEKVLAALPGITPEQAREIVAARERLGPEMMMATAWLVTEGILTEQDYEEVVDHVTTRCLQWRVRVEAGMVRGEPEGSGGGASGSSEALRPRVVLEAVIDVSSQRARVAYLRDVSMLDTAIAVLGEDGLREELGLGDAEQVEPEVSMEEPGSDGTTPPGESEGPGGEADGGRVESGRGRGPRPNPVGEREGALGEHDTGGEESESGFTDRRIGRWTPGGDRTGSPQGGGR